MCTKLVRNNCTCIVHNDISYNKCIGGYISLNHLEGLCRLNFSDIFIRIFELCNGGEGTCKSRVSDEHKYLVAENP